MHLPRINCMNTGGFLNLHMLIVIVRTMLRTVCINGLKKKNES
jgi:hypothetical protein